MNHIKTEFRQRIQQAAKCAGWTTTINGKLLLLAKYGQYQRVCILVKDNKCPLTPPNQFAFDYFQFVGFATRIAEVGCEIKQVIQSPTHAPNGRIEIYTTEENNRPVSGHCKRSTRSKGRNVVSVRTQNPTASLGGKVD